MHFVGRAAVLIAIIVTLAWAFTPSAHALPFTEAFGTFTNPTRSIDGDRSTVAEATGTPYRGEYFLVVRFSAPSIIRKLDVRFEGKAPKDYFIEMGPDAISWRPYEIGEKATYIRVRMKAAEGQIFKIAEIEANPEVAAIEVLAPMNIGVVRIVIEPSRPASCIAPKMRPRSA